MGWLGDSGRRKEVSVGTLDLLEELLLSDELIDEELLADEFALEAILLDTTELDDLDEPLEIELLGATLVDLDELLTTEDELIDEELLTDEFALEAILLDATELDGLEELLEIELLEIELLDELATDEEVTTIWLDAELDEIATEEELANDEELTAEDELVTTGADEIELLTNDEDELRTAALLADHEFIELLLTAADDGIGDGVEPTPPLPPPPQPERIPITERLTIRELTRITNLVAVILERYSQPQI
jgi:hypothetical protein